MVSKKKKARKKNVLTKADEGADTVVAVEIAPEDLTVGVESGAVEVEREEPEVCGRGRERGAEMEPGSLFSSTAGGLETKHQYGQMKMIGSTHL